MDNKISIIVPVYKVEAYLDRCVESIVNQTYGNLEIILVDDGSPDNSPQMCDAWAQRDSRIRVIHKENGGPSSARNRALEIATGDLLYFVDSDDYIERTLCGRMMELFEKHDVDVVTFNSWRVDERGELLGATETIQEEILTGEAALEALFEGRINHYAWNKMYRRHVFDGIRFPEERLWEDVAIAYKLILKADRIYCWPEKLYYYCENGNSIVATIDEKALCDIFLARLECYQGTREVYPEASRCAFGWVALAALNLYDRSLRAQVDERVLRDAVAFLEEHREQVLREKKEFRFRLYYSAPKIYTLLRMGVHKAGNAVKRIKKK